MRKALSLLCGLWLLVACSKKEEVYYSTTYPVTNVEVLVLYDTDSEYADEALMQQIEAEVMQATPVHSGGSYRLDFDRFDGGTLYVKRTAEASDEVGLFHKQPASREIKMEYADTNYVVTMQRYTSDQGEPMTLFEVDLTDYYFRTTKNLALMRVLRNEYTSHIYD